MQTNINQYQLADDELRTSAPNNLKIISHNNDEIKEKEEEEEEKALHAVSLVSTYFRCHKSNKYIK